MNIHFTTLAKYALLATLALSACKQNDPIRQKEREIEARKLRNNQGGEEPKPNPTPNPPSPPDPTPPNPNPNPPTPPAPNPNPPTPPAPEPPKEEWVETLFAFEHWAKPHSKAYYELPLLSEDEDPSQSYWVSASCEGYAFIPFGVKNTDPKTYPLLRMEGYKDNAVLLRSIKGFRLFGMGTNIIAGSLYSGKVDKSKMTTAPLQSTLFGQPWANGMPTELKVYYQYRSGAKVIHGEGKALPADLPTHDRGSISAVLYETTTNATPLDGTNLTTDLRIVARVYQMIEPTDEAAGWQELVLKFELQAGVSAESIDFKNKRYSLAIVASSSALGDKYIGAVGSELRLDELRIISKK